MRRFHYAWVVAAVTALVALTSASIRAAPGVLILPLESEFGWSRTSISFAVGLSILIFGLGAPIGGSLIDRFGPRRIALSGMALAAAGLLPMLAMRDIWQLHLFWGLTVGIGTGAIAGSLSATLAHRWFRRHRGLVIGLFGASTSAGQLIFVPTLMALTISSGWRSAVLLLAIVSLLVLLPVLLLLRDRPEDVGLLPYGESSDAAEVVAERAADQQRTPLAVALRTRDFWLLAGSFFVCGYTSNGLVGTHLIPHTLEHGFTAAAAASAVGVMGLMNVVGTLASGWLSDRFDNRKLLACYYGFRALSLAALPFILELPHLYIFAIVFGLDYIATVPPTANLTATIFGRASLGTIYGWIFFSHMVGGALAAYAGGLFHDVLGDYHFMFASAAILGFVAVGMALRIDAQRRPALVPA